MVFVDREETLELIASVRRRLLEGSSSVLFLEGDSGVGKSSLLTEARGRLSGADCQVVQVSCLPALGTGRQFGPFLEALDQLSAMSRRGRRRSLWARAVGRGATAAAPALLSAVVPGIGGVVEAGRLATRAALATGSIPGDSLGPVRSAMCRQMVEALLTEAREGAPVLLLVDDIQSCDEASRELLHMLLPCLEGEPLSLVLCLGSYASSTADGAAMEQLADVWQKRHNLLVARHRVPPLPEWAVVQLVRDQLEGHEIPAGFAARVHEATGGSPVFVEQVLRLWRPGSGTDMPLPDQLPQAVGERFERVDPQAQELLVLGATAGEFFFSHTLSEVTGLPQTQVQDMLHRVATEHGLVRERRRADMPRWAQALHTDWYDFEHRALQSCIRNEQSEGARLLRHARVAAALERLPRQGSDLPWEIRVLIAEQLLAAGPAQAAHSARAHYELARSVAMEELSFLQAAKYCRTAIEAARLLPEGDTGRDRRLVEATELLLSLTEVTWRGNVAEAQSPGIDTMADEAEQAARRLGDRLLIARTALLRGKTLLAVQGVEPSLEKLSQAVELARDLGAQGVETLFVALVEYGRQLPKRNLDAGLAVLFEAEELYASADQLGDTTNPVLHHARNLNDMQIGVNLFDAGRFGEAVQRLQRCVERIGGDVLCAELPIALNYLAQLHIAMGDYVAAEAALSRALSFEEAQHDAREAISGWHAYNNALLALLAARSPERLPEALDRIEQAWAETVDTYLVNLVPIVRNLYVEVLITVRPDDPAQALRLIGDTLAETEQSGMARSRIAAYTLRSRIRRAQDDPTGAADDARAALAILDERGPMPALRTEEVLHDAACALAAAGEDAQTGLLLERARAEVRRKADSIGDPSQRQRFLTDVPLNRALLTPEMREPGEGRLINPRVTVRDQGEHRTER
ncbi:AAA family ATPase [Streptomyces sp. TRM66268-LWL]|uniref:AAA family ATPase n=1 Tax=Streptomyces polyasparticus TaxID=2767826 RepID=A0ABR7SV90_9ACTN|nr:AAA family ATPase [Streptomyces polyasparticus]MBC9719422.1 AAA family ATPase [Streptomyces polyasparticus]